jgi:hypothetical protein
MLNRLALLGCLLASIASGQTNSSMDLSRSWPTNSYWTILEVNPGTYDTPYKISLFNPQNGEDGARVWSQTKSMFFYGVGVALFLAVLPESATGWDTEADIFSKWWENVNAGPEWDRNNWAYNYIGHTYVGGVYYQVARKSGYRQWDSFVYSFLMSTFYWEYGVEAFAEVPSIQDLAVTPIMGWVYGEWAYQTELNIREANNTVLGSKTLGGISLIFLDPIDYISRGVNRVAGRPLIKAGYGYFSYTAAPVGETTDHTVYLNMTVPIGGSVRPEPREPMHIDYRNDPVDTGIVGFTLGGGHTMLDDEWGLENDAFARATLGLYFTPRISTRLSYAWSDLEDQFTGKKVRYENYSLDTQCYLNTGRKLRPYVSGGVGELMWQNSRDMKYFQLNAGLGLHYRVHNKWALQAEWLNYYTPTESINDQTVSAAVVYRFGGGEHDGW